MNVHHPASESKKSNHMTSNRRKKNSDASGIDGLDLALNHPKLTLQLLKLTLL